MTRVSVLQLDTRFCRVPGDVGCAKSYINDPEIIRVPRTSVANIVTNHSNINQISLDMKNHVVQKEIIIQIIYFIKFLTFMVILLFLHQQLMFVQ